MAAIAPVTICACCGLRPRHNTAADCTGVLRDQIARLELRLLAQDREHFLRSVKRMRRERNLTQAQVGRLAGVSVNTVIQVERGRRSPKESTVRALRRVLMTPTSAVG